MAGAFVTDVWRRLPVDFRRGLAHGALSRFAPSLPPLEEPGPGAPHIVVGFLSSPSGLGQAARLAMKAFAGAGRDVYGIDLSRNFLELSDCVRFPYRDGRGFRGPAHVLININAPYLKYVFHLLGRGFLQRKKITGYWAWELQHVPPDWRDGVLRVHQSAAPSAFVADAVRSLGTGPPLVIAPYPVALEEMPATTPRTAPISDAAPFTVVFSFNVASGFERKNPLALIRAYRAAFGGRTDCRLRILASGSGHYPLAERLLREASAGEPGIELTFEAFDRPGYWNWYGRADLFASLHRAEGFGLGLAESMCRGIPALGTDWSANAEFMSADNSLPVRCALIPVADAQHKYAADIDQWAEPDIDHAASLMVRAAEQPDWLAALAARGQSQARERFSKFPL